MRDLVDEGFVVEDTCEFTVLKRTVVLVGRILCLDGIALDVEKQIAILRGRGLNAKVQTRSFRYQAWVRTQHNIFRYESGHKHRPCAHKHLYDTFGNGKELEILELADEDQVPTLGEAIRELQSWHQENAALILRLR